MKRRIGIYSGTFDPIHTGHIAFAQEAARKCTLDEVVFLPEHTPRGKEYVTDIVHRVALIEHATHSIPSLRALQLSSEQFTVQDTLPELKRIFPAEELVLLVGSDIVQTFLHRWPGLDMLLREMSLAIGMRSNDEIHEINTVMRSLEQTYDIPIDYTVIQSPDANLASSQIRNGTADMSQLHPIALTYIQQHGLYLQDPT